MDEVAEEATDEEPIEKPKKAKTSNCCSQILCTPCISSKRKNSVLYQGRNVPAPIAKPDKNFGVNNLDESPHTQLADDTPEYVAN